MTFCLGIKLESGLIAVADTRITSGTDVTIARKLSVYQHGRHSLFVMTSGLRSVRDKAITYFDEVLAETDEHFDKMFKAVNALGQQIRRVAQEDKAAIEESGLNFNVQCLVGGQLENDAEHKLFLLYSQGNWIEIGPGTPYHIIGEAGYGKPILRRALVYTDPLQHALKVGCLAFDSTRISTTDVDFPIDVAVYARDSYHMVEHRYHAQDMHALTDFWQNRLRSGVQELPARWLDDVFKKLPITQLAQP